MIVAKTKMKRIPETCKKCSFAKIEYAGNEFYTSKDRYCKITGYECPIGTKPSGNVGYGMPSWCPLMDIELIDDEGD